MKENLDIEALAAVLRNTQSQITRLHLRRALNRLVKTECANIMEDARQRCRNLRDAVTEPAPMVSAPRPSELPGYHPENLPKLTDDEVHLAKEQSKIAAIKAYRSRTGQGLRESKDAVEYYAERWGYRWDSNNRMCSC